MATHTWKRSVALEVYARTPGNAGQSELYRAVEEVLGEMGLTASVEEKHDIIRRVRTRRFGG